MELTVTKYKQTEVGLIPEDWDLVSFDKVFNFHSTSNYSKAQMSDDDEVGCIHYGLVHAIPNTQYNLKNGIKYYVSSDQAKYDLVRDGDVIMVDASEDLEGINKSVEVFGVADKKFISGLHTYLLRDKNSSLADNYRGFLLNSRLVKDQMLQLAVGMKVFGVSKTQLVKVKLPLPPTLNEQKAIAQVLSDTDALIQALEKKIAKKKLIKKGVMQQLLTPKEDWSTVEMSTVMSFTNGKPLEPLVNEHGVYNLITLDSISIEGKLKSYHKKVDINDNSLSKNDMVTVLSDIAHARLLGLTDLIPKDNCYVLNQRMGRLRFSENINPRFASMFINYNQEYFRNRGQGSSQRHIYKKDFDEFNFSYPTRYEQNNIALILYDIDKEIELLKQKLAKYQLAKQGMMQQLLTGKIRIL